MDQPPLQEALDAVRYGEIQDFDGDQTNFVFASHNDCSYAFAPRDGGWFWLHVAETGAALFVEDENGQPGVRLPDASALLLDNLRATR